MFTYEVVWRNGVLLPKVFWPTVRKKCSSDWEKLLKFETEGREFENFWKFKQIFTYICTFGFGFGFRPKARCFSGQIFGFGLKWKPYFRSFTATWNVFLSLIGKIPFSLLWYFSIGCIKFSKIVISSRSWTEEIPFFFHSFTFLAHTLIKQQDTKWSERQLSMEVHLEKKTLAKLAAYCTVFQKRFQDLWCTLG